MLVLACACGPKAPRDPTPAPETAEGPPPPAHAVPNAVVAAIPVEAFATAIAVSPDGRRAYATVAGAILVIDTATARVIRTIATGDTPHAIVLSRDGSRGYAVDLLQRELWIVDLAAARVSSRIPLGEPSRPVLRPGVALSPDDRVVYVTIGQAPGQGFDTLRIVDTLTGETSQRGLDFHPGQLVVDRSGLLWITGCAGLCSSGTLRLIQPGGIGTIAKIELPSIPAGIALTPGGRSAIVANGRAGSASIFDVPARSLDAVVPTGAEPVGVAFSPDGQRAYVTTFQSGELAAIDLATRRVVATATLSASPRAIAYVTHSAPVISVVDLTRLASRGRSGAAPRPAILARERAARSVARELEGVVGPFAGAQGVGRACLRTRGAVGVVKALPETEGSTGMTGATAAPPSGSSALPSAVQASSGTFQPPPSAR
jgi:YVTN family beta-propeller protein